MQFQYPLYLGGQPVDSGSYLDVQHKIARKTAFRVSAATSELIEKAIATAHDARDVTRALKPYERQHILNQCIAQFELRREELAQCLCIEAGKIIRDARSEVTRLIDTFRIASEEAVRIHGEVLNLEISARARGYRGMTQRVPIGVCTLISPFNFPLNLAAHKVAPAIAAGCPFILKPASRTPVSALILGEILSGTDLPPSAFSILPCERSIANPLIEDDRIQLLSFTGSPAAGWDIKARSGRKKVVLELGGNAACIVDEGANLDDVTSRLIFGAFYQAGQSCISVQRILIHRSIYAELRQRLVYAANHLSIGDPLDETTQIGALIDEAEAFRVDDWIEEAVDGGARLLCGGLLLGSFLTPALLENVPPEAKISNYEVFGPVAVLQPFDDFREAIREVNRSRFGLQAGVFTNDLYRMQMAWDELEVGGVIIGDVPSWRVDNMPYGGVKESGLGREGVRNAIEDMTEPRLLVIRTP